MTWLTGWTYRKSHTIAGSTAGAQTNYQVGIKVYRDGDGFGTENISGTTFSSVHCKSHCREDFRDIRFALDDGNLLPFWIESLDETEHSAIIWVKLGTIPASPATLTLYIYYGNDTAPEATNGSATFPLLFDHFDDGSLDAQWTPTTANGGTITESGTTLALYCPTTANAHARIYSSSTFQYKVFRARFKSSLGIQANKFRHFGFSNNPTTDFYALFDYLSSISFTALKRNFSEA